jgi:chromate transporter
VETTQSMTEGGDRKPLSLWNLCTGFLLIGLMGFGGIAASANYIIVENRKWLTPREFVEMFGICSILPGGNFLNAATMIGDEHQGPLGSILCLASLLLAPLVILLGIALVYDHFSYLPDVRAATSGAASAAAGLIFGTAARLTKGVERNVISAIFAAASFICIGVLRFPLWVIVVVICPLAIGWTLYKGRRA